MSQIKILNARSANVSIKVTRYGEEGGGHEEFLDVTPGLVMVWSRAHTQAVYVYRYDSQDTIMFIVDPDLEASYVIEPS